MMRERIISRGIIVRSRPSIVIVPEEWSRIRRSTERREDLPLWLFSYYLGDCESVSTYLPVRPHIPIFSPCLIVNETFCSAGEFPLHVY